MDKSIEEIFEELDQIMEKMEAADTSLEDSLDRKSTRLNSSH